MRLAFTGFLTVLAFAAVLSFLNSSSPFHLQKSNTVTKTLPGYERYECACSGTCAVESEAGRLFYTAESDDLDRIGEFGLAVLERNSVYRAGDLLRQVGSSWRRDSISILCEPAFRGTLLREVFRGISTIAGKPISPSLPDAAVESIISKRTDDGRRPGYALTTGRVGPSEVDLGHSGALMKAFARAVSVMHAEGRCSGADADEVVVPLRLGDIQTDVAAAGYRIDQFLNSQDGRNITKAVVQAVLHFGFNVRTKIDGTTETEFRRDKEGEEASLRTIREVVDILKTRGLEVRIRSEPNVDFDMCFRIFSKHFIEGIATNKVTGHGRSGFARVCGSLRHIIQERNWDSASPTPGSRARSAQMIEKERNDKINYQDIKAGAHRVSGPKEFDPIGKYNITN